MHYLITFACYGCHLHGSESGSVDTCHNAPRTPVLAVNSLRVEADEKLMDQSPYHLDQVRRDAVLEAIRGVCSYRCWHLLAAHVRSTHVHVVVYAEVEPEKIIRDFKSYASRRLNQMNLDSPNRKRWARHGSTRWLWRPRNVSTAIQYVVYEQGDPMSVFQSEPRPLGSGYI